MASPASTSTLGFGDVLRTPAVKRLWIAQLVSVFGDFLAIFAVISVVTFQLHGTPVQVSMILVSFLLPLSIVSPVAGVFVDKWNVKFTMIASDLIRGLLIVALLFLRDLYSIYAVFFLLATVSSFFIPAQAVALRTLAPPGGLMSANALMHLAVQVSMIIAPAVAGTMVDTIGPNLCFGLDILSFFVSAGLVATLTIKREAAPPTAATSILGSMTEGLRFIFSHAAISFVMIAISSAFFGLRCFGALLSVYVRDILRMDSTSFGVLNTMSGIGMILGGWIVRRVANRSTPQHLVIYGVTGMGSAVLITAIFGMFSTTAAGMFTLGLSATFIIVTAQTLMQHETPPEMLGRVSSAMMSLMAVAQVLALIGAGPVAEMAGVRNLFFGSAGLLLAIAAVGAWWVKS